MRSLNKKIVCMLCVCKRTRVLLNVGGSPLPDTPNETLTSTQSLSLSGEQPSVEPLSGIGSGCIWIAKSTVAIGRDRRTTAESEA